MSEAGTSEKKDVVEQVDAKAFAELKASVDTLWAKMRRVVKHAELYFGQDFDKDGKVGSIRIWNALILALIAGGMAWATSDVVVWYSSDATKGTAKIQSDDAGACTLTVNKIAGTLISADDITLEDGTSKITSGQTSGGTSTSIELVPKASVATNGVTRLVRIGDVATGDYFGFNASTNKRSVMLSVLGGRKTPAGANFDTTGDMMLHVGMNNNATNDAAYVMKAAYIKAKNSSAGTVGSIYGGDIEMQQDGTETTSVILRLRDSGSNSSDVKLDMYDSKTSGTADIRFPNGAIIKNGDANTLTITEATVAFSAAVTAGSTVAATGFKIGAVSGFSGNVTNAGVSITNVCMYSGGIMTNVVVTGP